MTMKTIFKKLLFLILFVLVVSAQAESDPINNLLSRFEKSLPDGWKVVKKQIDSIPYGHHFCDKYEGEKGIKLVITGPTLIDVVWTSESGETFKEPVAAESLDIWFMPGDYHNNKWAWLCFHRPLQPLEILRNQSFSIFGRPGHHLISELKWHELLTKVKAISWPESPAENHSKISWTNWVDDIRRSLEE